MTQIEESVDYKQSIESLQSVYLKYTITPAVSGSQTLLMYGSITNVGDIAGSPTGALTHTGDFTTVTKSNAASVTFLDVTFPDLGHTDYNVLGEWIGLGTFNNDSHIDGFIIQSKTSSSFRITIRESASVVQNMQFNVRVVSTETTVLDTAVSAALSVDLFSSSIDLSGNSLVKHVVLDKLDTAGGNHVIEGLGIVPITFRDDTLEITSSITGNAQIDYEIVGVGFSRQGEFAPTISNNLFGGQVINSGSNVTSGFIDTTTNEDVSASIFSTLYSLIDDDIEPSGWVDILPLRISKKATRSTLTYKSFANVSPDSILTEVIMKIDWLGTKGVGVYKNHQNGNFGTMELSGSTLTIEAKNGSVPNFEMSISRDILNNVLFAVPKDDNADFHTYELDNFNVNNNTEKTVRKVTSPTTLNANNRYVISDSDITLPEIDGVVDKKLISIRNNGGGAINISADGTSSIDGATSIATSSFHEYIGDLDTDSWIQIK
jgi:hypothetical protein